VTAGVTGKSTPLALVPILLPPEETVYHLIVLPADVAFIFDEAPAQIADGVAVTKVGAAGNGFTVTITEVRVALGQPSVLKDSAKYVVVPAGVTGKSAPLALVPILLPPDATVYHLIVLPADVAFRFDEPPAHIEVAVAVTKEGTDGKGLTVTVNEVRVALTQPAAVNASA
jgi:hypothetical protein